MTSQLFYRRTPYISQKYNDKMGVFMGCLQEYLSEKKNKKIYFEIAKELFENPKTKFSYEHFNIQQQDYDGFMQHAIRKQIFCLGEVIDEITDSFYQNTIFIMDNYNLKPFNPAVLSVSYANMKVLEKSSTVIELPKVTYIQLGLLEQELNKNFLYFNANSMSDKKGQKKESMSNVQYISMFHQFENKQKNASNDTNSEQQDSLEGEFGSWDYNIITPNCFEIAMNEYLEQKPNENGSSLNDIFFKCQQKCPKIIGSSEFLFLFEQVLKLVRNHKPNIILFAYDFSLTRAHNHYYDLKPDVLGYFSYMLSQISNHHVIFIGNTKQENHCFPDNISFGENQYIGLDGNANLNNYLSKEKISSLFPIKLHDQQELHQTDTLKSIDQVTQIYQDRFQGQEPPTKNNQSSKNEQNLQQQIDQDKATSQFNQKIQEEITAQQKNTKQSISAKQALAEMPTTYIDTKINVQEKDETLVSNLYGCFENIIKNDRQSKINGDYQRYTEEKFNTYSEIYEQLVESKQNGQNQSDQQRDNIKTFIAFQNLKNSQNLYQYISEQFHSVFFALLEVINYRKIIQQQSQKTGNYVENRFMANINKQIRSTVLPHKSIICKESYKSKEKLKWDMQHIKTHEYMIKIKQLRHIVDFVHFSNAQKVNLLQEISKHHSYTCAPQSETPSVKDILEANQKSMIINVIQPEDLKQEISNEQYTSTLVDGISKDTCDKLYSDQLKVKMMVKRFTQSLLNNWVYDLRRKKKVYLNVKTQNQTFDGEIKFFYTERSQHIIDYLENEDKIIIYFFNVQRGKVFKNFILTEVKENLFSLEEIQNQVSLVNDMLWKSFSGTSQLQKLNYELADRFGKSSLTTNIIPNQNIINATNPSSLIQNYASYEGSHQNFDGKKQNFGFDNNDLSQTTQQQGQQKENQDSQQNATSVKFYVHQEKLENLEIFNSALCITDKFIVRMFGEVINPTSWKQKEFSMMIFQVERRENSNTQNNKTPVLILANLEKEVENYIYKSIPRSGCTSVYAQTKDESVKNIYVFGGISYNGFLCNIVEIYQFNNDGKLLFKESQPKSLSQKIFRPLFCPFTFVYDNHIYFFGGEFGKKFVARALNQVYFQQYNIAQRQFKQVLTLNIKDFDFNLNMKGMEQKKYQEKFLKHAQQVNFYTTNVNQCMTSQGRENIIQFSLIGKVNSAIEQILEKTTVITLQISALADILHKQNKEATQGQDNQKKSFPIIAGQLEKLIKVESYLEDEKSQELRLNEYNSSKTFFLSSFQEQSVYLQTNAQNSQANQQLGQSGQQFGTQTQSNRSQTNLANNPNSVVVVSQTNIDQSVTNKQPQGGQNVSQVVATVKQPEIDQRTNNKESGTQLNQNMRTKNTQAKDLIDQINEESDQSKLDYHQDIADPQQGTSNTPYTIQVKKDFYNSFDDKIFTPKYFLCQNYQNKVINIVVGENSNSPQLTQKFQLTLRINDEDFKDALLSNQVHFLTYNVNMDKRMFNFYKTLSLEECTELSQQYGSRIQLSNALFKSYVKLDQQRQSIISLSPFDEEFEFLSPYLVNRYVTCDSTHIYLINGTDIKESYNQYNKLSPCERISIREKRTEKIPPCIFLDSKKSQILSNDLYIFYIGLYENQDVNQESEENDDEDSEDESSEQLIAQIFCKKEKFKLWRVIRINCKDLKSKFSNYQLLLGNGDNKIFAIKTQFQKTKKDFIVNQELTFDLTKTTCNVKTTQLPFNWQGQTKIQVIPSLQYSGTVYTAFTTNSNTYQVTSMIPAVRN